MSPNINIHILPSNESKNLNITYKFKQTKTFGNVLIGYYNEKICHVSFQNDETPNLQSIQQDFINCNLSEDTKNHLDENIFDITSLNFSAKNNKNGLEIASKPVDVLLSGTDFQIKTWRALTGIRKGTTVSYEEVAGMIGRDKKAVRAVAGAISKNKIAYFVPCHRVISKNGDLNKYRWGSERKKNLLDYEKIK